MSNIIADVVPAASEKKKLSFPTAYTVLLIVAALVTLLTWIVPAGTYDKLSYADGAFTVA